MYNRRLSLWVVVHRAVLCAPKSINRESVRLLEYWAIVYHHYRCHIIVPGYEVAIVELALLVSLRRYRSICTAGGFGGPRLAVV